MATVAAVAAVATDAVTEAPPLCAETATSWSSTQRLTVSRSQQTRTQFPPGTSPPTQIDRDRGPWIVLKHLLPTISLCTYWTPLASQVRTLEQPPRPPESLLLACQQGKHVRFNFPPRHTNKDRKTTNNVNTATTMTTQGTSD
jgi:hypothetical protein